MLAWFYREPGPVLLRNPIFCGFSGTLGSVRTPPPPSGSAHGLSKSNGDALLKLAGQIFASGSAVVYTHHQNTDTFRHMHKSKNTAKVKQPALSTDFQDKNKQGEESPHLFYK